MTTINECIGEFGEVKIDLLRDMDFQEICELREVAAERKRNVDAELSSTGKADRKRPRLVAEGQTLQGLLREVNAIIKQHNMNGHRLPDSPAVSTEGITAMEMWAGLAMAALIKSAEFENGPKAVAKMAWEFAEAMDDEAR